MINDGRTMVGISIPPDFGRRIKMDQSAEIQFLLDGSDSNTASIALGYAEAIVRTHSSELQLEKQNHTGSGSRSMIAPVELQTRVFYNSNLKSRNYIVPGLIAVILMFIATLLPSLAIAREWEMGTMEQLFSTAVRPAEIVLGKMAAYFCVGIVATLISIVIGIVVFKVPFRGSVLVLAISVSAFLCDALFWGLLLSAFTKNQILAMQMSTVSSFLPAFFLSGFVYAIESMPGVVRSITLVIPARHFVTILKGVFLKGIGFEILWAELLFLLLFATVIFWAATRQLTGKVA
jgi:ABC-2 type transport system permease protein